jgi:uncharacterized delta-60 repeat protein
MRTQGRGEMREGGMRGWRPGPRRRRSGLRPEVAKLEDRLLLSGAGDLDTSFASNGVAQINFVPVYNMTSSGQSGNGVAIDADGNIVAAGAVNSEPGSDPDSPNTIAGESAAVARLIPSGSPDSNFSSAPVGQVIINTSEGHQNNAGPTDYFNSVVQDSNGNILLNSTNDNIQIGANTTDLVLVGYHKDDGDFSKDPGEFSVVALTSVASQQFADDYPDTDDEGDTQGLAISFSALSTSKDNGDNATAALLQPDGTVLVTGSSGATNDQIPLARLNFALDQNNTNFIELDTSFGSEDQPGTELLDIPGDNAGSQFLLPDGIAAMAFQGSGKIILAGTATNSTGSALMLVRLLTSNDTSDPADDTIDPTFGTNGVELVQVPSGGTVSGVAVDPTSGRIVVSGSNYLAVMTASGAPDLTFGPSHNGLVSLSGLTGAAVALQSDGKIVVAGTAASSGHTIAALARYTSGGVLDTTFGSSGTGVVTTDVDGSGQSGYFGVAIDPSNDKIVVTGSAGAAGTSSQTAVVARYIGETPDITQLSPPSANQGGASFTLTVTGANFVNGSAILWNGTALTTTFVSATSLKATVPASDLAQSGTPSVTVSNPGNITSNAAIFTINAAPGITGLSPASANQGGASFTLTVTGANFVNGSAVLWNGAALTTTFASATSLTATVPASDIAQSGTASVTVSNPGNIKSNAKTFTINAVPGITQLSPTSANQSGASFTLTVTGANFVSGSAVLWNGTALTTTFASATSLTASVPASDLAQSGTASVTVSNPGNIKSNAETFTINAVPGITELSPTSANPGGASFTLTVTGSNFVSGSVVLWNGTALTTTFASATSLTATVPASDLAQSGTASVTVSNPGNVTSNARTFTIDAVPGITQLSPASANQSGASFTLTVTGANFVNGSAILWNGTALTTTFVSATSLTATVPASDLAQSGTASVTVSNPGNVTSNAATFTINAVPGITGLSPDSANQGGASFTLTVTGVNFVNGSAVLWNGAALTTTFVSSTSLTTIVPASDLVQPGTANVRIISPGNFTSSSANFTIVAAPGITGLSPASANQGGASFPLTVTGANFVNGSTILWNGAALTTTFVSATTLTATVPASDLAQSGTASVTVSNPVNSTSSAVTFTITAVAPPPPPPPHVVQIARGSHTKKGLTSITVSFDESMNPSSVVNSRNYTVYGGVTNKKHRVVYNKRLNIRVMYNDGSRAAIITLSKPYKGPVRVTVGSEITAVNGTMIGIPTNVQVT